MYTLFAGEPDFRLIDRRIHLITGKEMEKLKIIPPDAQIYAQVKASWDKIAKPLDGLGQFETMFAQIGAITGSSSLSIEKK